uniref:30S ribosomal protein S19 n=1 Tax=Nephromyces sp. ex Molgula occidentalis TaxID=2544991 RepID=A0A5C1H7U9_9APIC|nr:30S ribosomal protein S19 [Nephromyces sp. ex Molgula occidentalis]
MKKIFISKDFLRKLKLIKKYKFNKFLYIYNKSNNLIINFLNIILNVYNGKKFFLLKINKLKLNYKLGSFLVTKIIN